MNKQTEDKILEMLLHVHEKSTGAHPFTRKKMVLSGGLSVVVELGPQGRNSLIWVLMPTLPRSFG